MSFTIRKPIPQDFDALTALHMKVWGLRIHFFDIKEFNSSFSTFCRVAEKEKKLIGYILAFRSWLMPSRANLQGIWINEPYRDQGIGKSLLQEIEEEIQKHGIERLTIRLPERFYPVIGFFEQAGNYKEIEKINLYYRDDLNFPFNGVKVTIREAKEKDISSLVLLEKKCFTSYWQIPFESFEKIIPERNRIIFLAFLDGKLVGYNYNQVDSDRNGHYIRIATLPNYRRQGIATTLTKEAFGWFSKYKARHIFLSTFAKSIFHNEMYKHWGFNSLEQEIIFSKLLTKK